MHKWKKKLQSEARGIFETNAERKAREDKNCTEDDLMKKIGRLDRE